MSNPDHKIKTFQLHEGKTSIKQIGLVLAVALFFIGLVWLGGWGGERGRQDQLNQIVQTRENIVAPQITKAKEGELPEGFPEIPLNDKKEFLTAYTLNYKTGSQDQKIIEFTSLKSVKENFDFYINWAGKNGWNILHQFDNSEVSRVIIEKDRRPLNITIQQDTELSSKVNMSW